MIRRVFYFVIFLSLLLFGSMPVLASTQSGHVPQPRTANLYMSGAIEFSHEGISATIAVARIDNRDQTFATGPLRLEAWATRDRPVYGADTITPVVMASYTLGSLPPNSYYHDLRSNALFFQPQPGTYFITMALIEIRSDGRHYVDLYTFDTTETFGGGGGAACTPTASSFCAQNNRFTVSILARNQRDGATDVGHVMSTNGTYGFFALPTLTGNTTDPSFLVKVLDGRGVNGFWWVFFSTLTDVEVTLTVTDTQTGAVRTYTKPAAGTNATFDTSAFQ